VFERSDILIGSQWATPQSDQQLTVRFPFDQSITGKVPKASADDVDRAVEAAREAFRSGPWPRMSIDERGERVRALVAEMAANLDMAVELQVGEMGTTTTFSRSRTSAFLNSFEHTFEVMSEIAPREIRHGRTGRVLVTREPLGVLAAITPWNVPIPLVLSKLLGALLSGCSVVVKTAVESPLSAYVIGDAITSVGLPDGVCSIFSGDAAVGEYLVQHQGVDGVTFTGSTAAGSRVGALCGTQLKPATLELGGKSAALVLDDADLDSAIPLLIGSSMPNTGQICFATTRILVPKSRSDEISKRLVSAVSEMKVGDPRDANTEFGPLVSERQRDRVEGYIIAGREEGATVLLGGARPDGFSDGWFVEPTILADVTGEMTVAQEEIFGPVVCIMDYDDDEDAVRIANDSQYGLGGAVFTEDVHRGVDVASRIQTGTCRVNEAPAGGDGAPLGGWKNSGLGYEHGREGYESLFSLRAIALPSGYVPDACAATR
jgi:aldehyde dehydrogenase (NAD+)